ncbi:gliding motility lipoprotein GldH [Flavobacterium sp. GT3R68]|uniref:gliding motility lipoprotein GldH n=1 Tax=Flavobacterium sp. GT3R68 TaxID=2594437 RepID=UPI000F86DAC6|nr:gliding motility lipoprotein GldH [Flavobacterium sp. GT3R68]RTY95990.1 gliding motility lipoprotein GldH [Flavobacterium sp. GSN2]TRW93763.1 gliding motility lipoprotein GldH [Flavobacterium sp. GT3R68]
MSLKNSILFILIAGLLFSCDKKRVFDEYKSVGDAWNKKTVVEFNLPEMDTTKKYNLFVNLRANDGYKFNNLFLIVALEQPDGLTKVDTLEYLMAEPDGTLLGDGFSDIKESKLFYKSGVQFKSSKKNKVLIKQAVRQTGKVVGVENLEGITQVGFRIESLE